METHTFEKLRSFRVEPSAPSEIRLARFFISVPANSIAVRLTFDLELRSGVVERAEGELPAMRLRVAEASATRLSDRLEAQGAASPGDLAALVQRGSVTLEGALELAVRVPFDARTSALEALRPIAGSLPGSDMLNLVPTLRWLSRTGDPGGDPEVWRAYLQRRGGPLSHGKPEKNGRLRLELPGGER